LTDKIVHSNDHDSLVADSFEVLIDPKPKSGVPPVIGLKVNTKVFQACEDGKRVDYEIPPFIMPMEYETAKALAESIYRTLLCNAPELFAEQIAGLYERK
jgi:hypothetical protein